LFEKITFFPQCINDAEQIEGCIVQMQAVFAFLYDETII